MRRGIVAAAAALLVAAADIAGVVWVRRTQDKATPQAAIAPVVVLEAAGDAGVAEAGATCRFVATIR